MHRIVGYHRRRRNSTFEQMKEMGCEANIGFGQSPKAALFSFWMQPQTLSKYKYVRGKKEVMQCGHTIIIIWLLHDWVANVLELFAFTQKPET